MRYQIVPGERGVSRQIEAIRKRCSAMRPASAKCGEFVAREARRNAPRGRSRRGTSLASSMAHNEPRHDETVLTSDKVYARVQAEGTGYLPSGRILPGGKLGARMLAVPVSDEGRALLDRMPSGQSLRSQNLKLIRSKAGKLLLIQAAFVGRRGKKSPATNTTRVMFVLVPSTRLRPNPAPRGYVPRMTDVKVVAFFAATVKRYITTGSP